MIKIKTVIVGKNSNLSRVLSENLLDVELISAREVLQGTYNFKRLEDQPIFIILNNFQPANHLYDLTSPLHYVESAIVSTSKVLEAIMLNNLVVKKIIYTSSSSVYGDNIFCRESDNVHPMSLHASLKVTNEQLIKSFCDRHDIEYCITRIFNMFGGEDNFSIINKIIKSYKNNEILSIVNQGNAIRDFIHVDDVVQVYLALLETELKLDIVNVGTGIGRSIRGILDSLEVNSVQIKIANQARNEIKISTASTDILQRIHPVDSFQDVRDYTLKQLVG